MSFTPPGSRTTARLSLRAFDAVAGRAGVRVQAFAVGDATRHRAQLACSGLRYDKHAAALLEIVHAERRGKARAARRRQHVIRSRAVIAQCLGAVVPNEDGAGVADEG